MVGEGGVRVVEHVAVEGASQASVGGVEDPHTDTVSQPTDINDGGLRRSVTGFLVRVLLGPVLLVLGARRRLKECLRLVSSTCCAIGAGEVVA